ncbi:WG repeat-containing protein [Macellibacteroides fermentans]|uniref:WG repeat-containing protein n=1 Tax=Macellibacteroides fermentans TaxID=879969 RepID=UPI00406C0A4A
MRKLTSYFLILLFVLGSFITASASTSSLTKREFLPGIPSANYGYFSGIYMKNPPWENQDGLIKVKGPNGKWGYVDMNGKLVIGYEFEEAGDFSDGLAAVGYSKPYGTPTVNSRGETETYILPMSTYINTKGELIREYVNASREDYSEGLAVARNGKSGYVDTNENVVIDYQFDQAWPFKNGFAKVMMNGKFGFVDKAGNIRVECKYDRVGEFSEGLAAVSLGGKWGYVDTNGNPITGFIYDDARPFSDGMAVVCINDSSQQMTRAATYGYIDKSGNLIIPIKYKVAGNFSEGLAAVCNTNKLESYYIDKKGNKVIDKGFTDAGEFSEGYAYVSYNWNDTRTQLYGFINRAGELVVSYEYDNATCFYDGKALVKKGNAAYVLEVSKTPLIEKQKKNPIGITVNNQAINFTGDTGYPFIDNARTLTPIRAVLETFGATVDWDAKNKSVIVKKGATTVIVPVDARYILVNGERQYMDSYATVVNGRTYLPIRAVIEAFGGTVTWDAANNRIGITG